MAEASAGDEARRRGFVLCLAASLAAGTLLGRFLYGDLLDVRCWTTIGVVVLVVLGGYAGIVAWRARESDRRDQG